MIQLRDHRDPLDRRQFWPRPGRPEALGEIEFENPCGNCGYNLRGLLPGVRCPECGSRFGWAPSTDPIPWEDPDSRFAVVAYLATVIYVIFRPHDFADQLWRPMRLDLSAAKRFRRISLCIATLSLSFIAWAITANSTSWIIANAALPFDVAAIIVWLNMITLAPIAFFSNNAGARLLRRTQTLSHYAAAPLALMPLTLALLAISLRVPIAGAPIDFVSSSFAHIVLALLVLSLGLPSIAWLMFECVQISAAGAFGVVITRALPGALGAFVMLIGVPVMATLLVSRILPR